MDANHKPNCRTKPSLTIAEAADLSGLSRQTITRMFENEKDVRVIDRPETRAKRRYRTIRIPSHVYERVMRRISN